MVDVENIVFNKKVYYTPSWTGVTKVAVLAIYNRGKLLVQAKNEPFIRVADYVFDEPGKARKSLRQWQHYEKKRKKSKKKSKEKGEISI